METPEFPVKFDSVDVSEIVKRDPRYDSRAYDLVLGALNETMSNARKRPDSHDGVHVENGRMHSSAEEVLLCFREMVLDMFGPMSMTVLEDFGIHSTEDVGEIMKNLCEAKLVAKSEKDSFEDFVGGFNFTEAFVWPFES